ncbi:MAG: hypothetical protein FJ280_27565 [Planctomycetes bacterium]|nr:hypothetical protein [Planctomycetota bacterium]
MSDPMRLLLDKSVVRRYFEGVAALARGLTLTAEEQHAVLLVHLAHQRERRLFLPIEAYHLLMAHGRQIAPAETLMFLKRVDILYPARYFKRWARRVRARTFTPEDAKVLALGTFGTDERGELLGVHAVVTHDQPMVRKWEREQVWFGQRLREMARQLDAPYASAILPEVRSPRDVT